MSARADRAQARTFVPGEYVVLHWLAPGDRQAKVLRPRGARVLVQFMHRGKPITFAARPAQLSHLGCQP